MTLRTKQTQPVAKGSLWLSGQKGLFGCQGKRDCLVVRASFSLALTVNSGSQEKYLHDYGAILSNVIY